MRLQFDRSWKLNAYVSQDRLSPWKGGDHRSIVTLAKARKTSRFAPEEMERDLIHAAIS